jgi:hypothetical protein
MFGKKSFWRGAGLFAGAAALLVTGMTGAYAAPGGVPGPGGGGGGGNGGGGNGGGGGGNGGGGGGGKGEVYSDLVVAYRDARGLPIMAEFDTLEGSEFCVQPVSYVEIPGLESVINPVNGGEVWLVPLVGADDTITVAEEEEVEVCDPQVAYAGYVQEVELERLNQGRSPSKVVERQLGEVQVMLAQGELTLEPSGRWVAGGVTIDSPLMNTAIYLELMLNGEIYDANGNLVTLPAPIFGYDFVHHAAVALAMAGGKEVPIGVDTIAYHNRVLDIPARTNLPTLSAGTCEFGMHEVDETVYTTCGVEGEEYVDYGGFGYDRATTYPGCAYYHPAVQEPAITKPIMTIVFGDLAATGSALDGVALQADDARRVNLWTHDNELLILEADPLGEADVCAATP